MTILHGGYCEADRQGLAPGDGEIWDVYCYHDARQTPDNPHDDSELHLECHLLTY